MVLARPMLAARNIYYDLSERDSAVACGGIGSIPLLARKLGLSESGSGHPLFFSLPCILGHTNAPDLAETEATAVALEHAGLR